MKRLQGQNDHIRPEEIENAVQLREGLTSLIESAQVRLDAVQMIQIQP